ncbi:MAG: alpha-L-rhamnosidase C-terminal domain-containing protein, partial [Candidatus Neoclostridium sp.]
SLLSTAYFAFSASLTVKMCEICADPEKAYFEALYDRIKVAFRTKFLLSDGRLSCHTQTAYLLAYASGVMSKEEIRAPFIDTVHKADDKLTTGFLGIKFLLPTLCDLGESELAYKILCSREYPGWGYSAANGATTMWERWNSYTADKGFGDVSMNSFNHYSFGSVAEWMFKYCLGIRPDIDGAGFKKLILRPAPDFSGRLTHAEGSYSSKQGKISARWVTENGTVRYFARVPKGIELVVDLPENVTAEIERY